MKVLTDWDNSGARITLEIGSRDDLERMITFLPSMRFLYPYPDPPADPELSESMNTGSAAPVPLDAERKSEPEPVRMKVSEEAVFSKVHRAHAIDLGRLADEKKLP